MSLHDLSEKKQLMDSASAASLGVTAEQIEKAIRENHAADVSSGMSEFDADASDAFERRVLGLDEPDTRGGRYGAAGYSGCYDGT